MLEKEDSEGYKDVTLFTANEKKNMKISKLKIVKKKPKNVVFDELPPQIQAQIQQLIITDFRAAKAVYDDFLRSRAYSGNLSIPP